MCNSIRIGSAIGPLPSNRTSVGGFCHSLTHLFLIGPLESESDYYEELQFFFVLNVLYCSYVFGLFLVKGVTMILYVGSFELMHLYNEVFYIFVCSWYIYMCQKVDGHNWVQGMWFDTKAQGIYCERLCRTLNRYYLLMKCFFCLWHEGLFWQKRLE